MYLVFLALALLCIFLVFYSYVLFPAILILVARNKVLNREIWDSPSDLPFVSIIISAFNEEKVIGEKLAGIRKLDYPADKIEVIVGSDGSTDRTAVIVQSHVGNGIKIRLVNFPSRRGKPSVINDLVKECKSPVIIFTDANVLLDKASLRNMVRHFKNPRVGLVGANILNMGMKEEGISSQEKSYIQRENRIKYLEGKVWGSMMGPFGGCYAMRRELYVPVPENFLVDDFYICMKVLEKKYACILEPEALCFEDVPDDIFQEYRRKARISAGNFQNLSVFKLFLLKPFSATGFTFISHKVLRWFTPFFILVSLISLLVLSFYSLTWMILFIVELLSLVSPVFDWLLKKAGIKITVLRFVTYFLFMNLALVDGFFKYLRGIESSIWTPTKRV